MSNQIDINTTGNIPLGNLGTDQTTFQSPVQITTTGPLQTTTQKITTTTNTLPSNDILVNSSNGMGVIPGTTKTTITTTQYGLNPTSGIGLTNVSNINQIGEGGDGLLMGERTIQNNTQVIGPTTTTSFKTQLTPYELGQNQAEIINDGGKGYLMGVGGGNFEGAQDVTYSSNTHGLGAAAAKTTTTTTVTKTQYGLGQTQGEGSAILSGIQNNSVNIQSIGTVPAQLTTTTTTTETNLGSGLGITAGTRKSVDISKYATTQTINEGVDIKSLEI